MKKILFVCLPVLSLALAGCTDGSSASTVASTGLSSDPPRAQLAVQHPLSAPPGTTVTYDNHGAIDGLYNCSLTNTHLFLATSDGSVSSNPYAPQLYLSVNGKSDGKAHVIIAQTSAPDATSTEGSADVTVSGHSIRGTTSEGGAIAVDFSFSMDASGYENINATGTVVLNGKDVKGANYSNTANISCASVWNI